jgi:hypothetical protein
MRATNTGKLFIAQKYGKIVYRAKIRVKNSWTNCPTKVQVNSIFCILVHLSAAKARPTNAS